MCRMKLIDIENFKEVCLKTLNSLRDLLENPPLESILIQEDQSVDFPESNTEDDIEIEKKPTKRGRPKKLPNKGVSTSWGEFCREVLQKMYPKQKKKQSSSVVLANLDTFCNVCRTQVKPYKNHILQNHFSRTEDTGYTCDLCTTVVATSTQAISHFEIHRNFSTPQKCLQCEESFISVRLFKNHLKVHDDAKAFPCLQCENSYKRRNSLFYHITTSHLKKFVCCYCFTVFDEQEDFKRHYQDEKRTRSKKVKKVPVIEEVKVLKEEKEGQVQEVSHMVTMTLCTHCNVEVLDYSNHIISVSYGRHIRIIEIQPFDLLGSCNNA